MSAGISKNSRRLGQNEKGLMSRWGGVIKMKSVFENGKLKHVAYCEKWQHCPKQRHVRGSFK